MADQDQDPFASIATPIAAAPATRQPLRNPRIAGNEPDPFASIATPIATAPAAPPKQPTLGEVLTQDTDKTDAEYKGYKGVAGVAGATIKGLDDVAREGIGVAKGVGNAILHPIDTAKSAIQGVKDFASLPDRVREAGGPEVVKDINASPDPLSHYADAAQDTASQGAAQALLGIATAGGPRAFRGVAPKPISAIIPETPVIAGTELPETVGGAMSRANPGGVGTDIKGLEDISKKIPGSERLREVGTGQQAGAREIIANKLSEATGAQTSTAPEAVEQNVRNAAEAARQTGNAKYKAIAQAAQDADLTKPVGAAHDILQDEATMKVLPKSARDALGKLASSMSEREEIAQQIYGKSFSDLEPTKQAEVTKALGSNPATAPGFQSALDARSELGTAANAARDNADARLLHLAHEQMGQAINDTLQAHDASLVPELAEADKTWSQKYAMEKFLDKIQSMNRDQPRGEGLYAGHRELSGADLQKIVNDLDPLGAKGKTDLQRMFPDNPQAVKDMHELADFMGHNQGDIGNLASGMAKKQILGLQSRALMLIGNNIGLSYLLSKPGIARAFLTILRGGKDVAKLSAAIGQINHAANLARADRLDTPPVSVDSPSSTAASQDNPTTVQPNTNSAINPSNTNNTPPAITSNTSSITTSVPRGRVPVSVPGTHKLYHFSNQKAADDFKKAAGIQ